MPKGWSKIRRRIMQRDRWECQYDVTSRGLICGQQANEVDHIVPRSEGGTDDPGNLQAICRPHHRIKTQEEATRARAR